ncbi:FAD:protein FMN transferase [Yimella sp. cx-51]|uniref:FAD:protein FMN transferase n=1 Tax=Yimella sp. cx-51 TaxID=2770551 RepID=UPI00165E2F12|nr:FAD:protein FMN transferase [Yimella sp. cx-51]MBC9955575.1 FAD:protein FMN transferase [Yimella sp. cx-51]QTH37848.1 FAD:protein FMN transferase [Yimella sp. cx-51]
MRSLRLHAWTTRIHVVMTDDDVLPAVQQITEAFVQDVDLVASRFREDSELAALNRAARRDDVDADLSPLLRACLKAALRTAELTDGLVTPTVGRALVAAGYDRDIDQIDQPAGTAGAFVPDYQRISLRGRGIRMPQGFQLDLGASAKAWAADVLAADLADRLRGGFLVNLGGDIAVAGHAPRADWQIGVEAADGRVVQTISTRHQAFATSSTQVRSWHTDHGPAHHIIDPRTGQPAEPVWVQVTCAGASAVEANAASTAAIVLAHEAPEWLAQRGIPALLIAQDGRRVHTPRWAPERSAA